MTVMAMVTVMKMTTATLTTKIMEMILQTVTLDTVIIMARFTKTLGAKKLKSQMN